MVHQAKLTYTLNPNKFKNCELKQCTGQNKIVFSIIVFWDTLYDSSSQVHPGSNIEISSETLQAELSCKIMKEMLFLTWHNQLSQKNGFYKANYINP